MKIKNAKRLPQVFYGLHFAEGLAQYNDEDGKPYNILITSEVMRKMDKTYQGKPLFVETHKDYDNITEVESMADGYVLESFYCEEDGKHWCKFLAITDAAFDAIEKHYKLSNSYFIKEKKGGGERHSIPYKFEVADAYYDHMALVASPRYEESVVLTPEEFKEYKEAKRNELLKVANSKKGENAMNIKFWKKEKVENSADLETTVVELPLTKKAMSITEVVEFADKVMAEEGKARIVNSKDKVKVGEETMTISQLVEKLENAKKKNEELEKKMAEKEEKKDNEDEELENEDEKENEDKKENEDEEKENEDEKKENSKHFDALKKAGIKNSKDHGTEIELVHHQVARGQSRYGS